MRDEMLLTDLAQLRSSSAIRPVAFDLIAACLLYLRGEKPQVSVGTSVTQLLPRLQP